MSRSKRKLLLVYFSRAGENYFNGGRKVLTVGNTEVVARMIHEALDCEVFRIQPVEPYSDRYEPTVERNVREQNENARPAIVGLPASIAAYDTSRRRVAAPHRAHNLTGSDMSSRGTSCTETSCCVVPV